MKTTPGFVTVTDEATAALTEIVGADHVVLGERELDTLSKDCYWYSPVLKARLEDRRAAAAVRPGSVSELRRVLALAYAHDLPVTVRGGATGNYGQCIPLCGGLVVDIGRLERVIDVSDDGVLTVEPGARVIKLEAAARERGWELRCYPSTWVKSTVSGFIAGGSAGIGSITWGGLRENGTIKRVTVLTMEAEPREIVLEEAEALKAFHTYGTTGVIIELQLRLAPARRWEQLMVTSTDWEALQAFTTEVAMDEAVPKRLVSLSEASFGAVFRPLKKWIADGHALALFDLGEECAAEVVARAKAHGLTVALTIPHHEPRRQPMLAEYGWNHATLWMLKAKPGRTYLQLGMGQVFAPKTAALQARFPGKLHVHYEFVRGRDAAGNLSEVVAVWIPVVETENEDELREIVAVAETLGIRSGDPHTCYVEDGGADASLPEKLLFKQEVDPKGLLNPGKMKRASAPEGIEPTAFPVFLRD
ncbi:MAG: FAD-binding oxidoreductase [Verrucomicrobia bacterium]|nr:MAG: FAD-binding oxidoreductase [Verrucomicrobiota bacterium]